MTGFLLCVIALLSLICLVDIVAAWRFAKHVKTLEARIKALEGAPLLASQATKGQA